MSGIFAYCTADAGTDARAAAERMGSCVRHADYHTVEIDAPAPGLAIGRIGIGILNAAPQPVRQSGVSLWFAGELYRRAGTGNAPHAEEPDDIRYILGEYLCKGREALTRLNGAFVVALWDARSGELLIVNDRYGFYPQYYAHVSCTFVVAPEMKGVLATERVRRRVDVVAVAEYTRFQQMLGDRTWIEDIRLLPPSTMLRYHVPSNTLRLSRYWDWDAIRDSPPLDAATAFIEASRLLKAAVARETSSPHRLGLYLSGGLDSRALLACLHPERKVTTFTYGDPACRDMVYAARLARRARVAHSSFPLLDGRWVLESAPKHFALTEGMHCWLNMHGMTTLEDARRKVDVMLNGWRPAGVFRVRIIQNALRGRPPEQAFGGQAPPGSSPALSEPDLAQRLYEAFCQRLTWPGPNEGEAAILFSGQGNASMRWMAFDSFRDAVAKTRHYPDDRRPYILVNELHNRRLLSNLNVFTRAAVEVRSPFFDQNLVEFLFSVPDSIRAMEDFLPRLLTRLSPSLARIPYEQDDRVPHTNPWIRQPYEAIRRLKRVAAPLIGLAADRTRLYADYEEYLRTDLRAWAEDLLLGARARSRGFFDPDAVADLWARHLSGRQLWTIGKIAPLMTIEMAMREFGD